MRTHALELLAVLLLSACNPSESDDGAGGAGGAAVDPCAAIVGKSFSSVELLETGLGPDGPVMGHWSIFFTETGYAWSYSDVGDSGDYTCVDGALTGSRAPGAERYEGQYDPASDRLIWDGVEYEG